MTQSSLRWMLYVTCRFVCRLPCAFRNSPGAAGVLLNQTYLYNDLFVLVDPLEKQMVDAIDGRRSIAEIVDVVNDSALRKSSRNSGGTIRSCLTLRRAAKQACNATRAGRALLRSMSAISSLLLVRLIAEQCPSGWTTAEVVGEPSPA